MTKYMLDVEFDYDFQLIGICAQAKDYKMAWEINGAMSINLERDVENFDVVIGKQKSEHPIFRYQCEQSHVQYELLSNKGSGGYLVPEKKQVQYFFLLFSNILSTPASICNIIKKVPNVSMCFEIDIESLINKENLITA